MIFGILNVRQSVNPATKSRIKRVDMRNWSAKGFMVNSLRCAKHKALLQILNFYAGVFFAVND